MAGNLETTGSSFPAGRKTLGAAAVLVALTVLAYLPVLRAGFIWDDDTFLTANPSSIPRTACAGFG